MAEYYPSNSPGSDGFFAGDSLEADDAYLYTGTLSTSSDAGPPSVRQRIGFQTTPKPVYRVLAGSSKDNDDG